jgi:hypothetical protein
MSVNQKFAEQILSLTRKGIAQSEGLRALGFDAVKKAYNSNMAYAQFMLDNLTQAQRKPLARWFKRAGLNIVDPSVGSARYMAAGIIDAKRQGKAFTFCETTQVLEIEHAVTQPKTEKPLEGTPFQRATAKVASAIKAMREKDPEGAAALNELAQVPAMGLYLENGERIALSYDEMRAAQDAITRLRLDAQVSAQTQAEMHKRVVAESRVH